jgi:hypothetical protein
MKIEHLAERAADYKTTIETVVAKKSEWQSKTKVLLLDTLKSVVSQYDLGWRVQELDWIHNNEAINITFESFPPELMDCTNKIPAYQFIPGGALVFSQSHNGDVFVFVLFPVLDDTPVQNNMLELGVFNPKEITEKLIVEKADEFLKEMIKWEVPSVKKKVGY